MADLAVVVEDRVRPILSDVREENSGLSIARPSSAVSNGRIRDSVY